jgi:hypothetical protein
MVILSDLRSIKVRRSVADQICRAYALQNRHVENAAAIEAAASQPSTTVAPTPHWKRTLSDAATIVIDATAGDDAAARQLLLGVLDALSADTLSRRNTHALQRELTTRWTSGAGDAGLSRILVPTSVPIVVDPRLTLARALGGAWLNDVCYRVCRSRVNKVLLVLTIVSAFTLFEYILSSHDNSALPMFYAVTSTAFISSVFQLLLLNTVVLSKIVLRRWDTWWSLSSVSAVAVTGFFIFKDPQHGIAWFLSQLQMSTYYFRDAAPPSKIARRIDGLALAFNAAANCYAVFAIWLDVFHVKDYFVDVLGMPVNLRQWCFTAQINTAIISIRFAVRALADQRNLMFAAGLIRVRMPAADARELRAMMLAERQVRSSNSNNLRRSAQAAAASTVVV